jgi:hypothetical protein
MTKQVNVKPMDEQSYLMRNALLSVILGTSFVGESIYSHFEQYLQSHSLINAGVSIIGGGIFIGMIVMLIKTLNSANKVLKKTFYYGNFEDEYLNYINAKGYKYACNFILFFCFVIYILSDFNGTVASELMLSTSTREFCQLTVGLIFISYALPVLYLLKGADDE